MARFRCGSEDAARNLVNTLLVAGLYPELREPQLADERWELEAPVELVPTELNLADLEDAMRQVARRSGASFEGFDPEA